MSNIQDLINTLELSYTNNHLLVSIEKKYIKLVNIEIVPHIEVILCQYYLVILGGDYQNLGLVIELKNYITKMKSNLEQIKKINYLLLDEEQNQKIKVLNDIISNNYNKSLDLYKKMYEHYQIQLENSLINKECNKFRLNDLHKLQLQTNYNYFNNINDENHNNKLNELLEFLNKLLENENEKETLESEKETLENEKETLESEKETLESEKETLENEKETLENEKETLENEKETLEDDKESIYIKFIDSQISVIEQQFEILKI
jgi:hypothetical protein